MREKIDRADIYIYRNNYIIWLIHLFFDSPEMFDLLRMVFLLGFNPSGPDSADKIVSDDCAPEFQKTVARRASHLQSIGEMAVHCADGNMLGRWDRPVFDVTPTVEEMSGFAHLEYLWK